MRSAEYSNEFSPIESRSDEMKQKKMESETLIHDKKIKYSSLECQGLLSKMFIK
jgi:lysozyme family protein